MRAIDHQTPNPGPEFPEYGMARTHLDAETLALDININCSALP